MFCGLVGLLLVRASAQNPTTVGTCWSGNWTQYMNDASPVAGEDNNLLATFGTCDVISSAQVRDPTRPDVTTTDQVLNMDAQTGVMCYDADQSGSPCIDYEVRFCCEDCCPMLNVSGDPELTDYYENYPGIYELQADTFNDFITYKQIAGVDEVGNTVYGEGVIYYWEDVGWLLGANTFTYSYYSDGIGQRCPQFAPSNWTNEVYGTQLWVECKAIYPTCNDVECVENAICRMTDDGPECVCEDGFELYEDGQCLNETVEDPSDGYCGPDKQWSEWLNSDTPAGAGDWETLGGFAQSLACMDPCGIQAQRTDNSTHALVTHISKEMGFWCVNAEQDGVTCADFQVRFCCPKYSIGSDCSDPEYDWSQWQNLDGPDGLGDWEMATHFGESDVCSNPIGSEARKVNGSTGADDVTHIETDGFWCINEEQNNGAACADFEARFCCPTVVPDDTNTSYIMDGTCDADGYAWTTWLNTDTPAGNMSDGDWETLGRMPRMHVCSNPSGIQARTSGPGATEVVHIHKESGFWCENAENSEDCADFEVRFCCPQFKTGECTGENAQWTGWYNDEWNKKNERIWVSNQDELELLQTYGDGAACASPSQAEVRPRPTGSTSYQTTMWSYAENLVHHLTPEGYRCHNQEQVDDYHCIDMEIRFCCPDQLKTGECDGAGQQWTGWLDNDTPDGDGDWETRQRFPAQLTCDSPTEVQARATDDGSTEYTHIDPAMGFYCLNAEQSFGGLCANFEVRFCCPTMQVGECNKKGWEWTGWLDRDDPDGTGDWENLHAYEPNQACLNPSAVKVQDLQTYNDGVASATSDLVTHLDLSGFYCINDEQTNGLPCSDFAISFCCPVEEDVTCEYAVCDENEWCLETAEGPLCKCGDDDFNDDHDAYDFVEYEDGECIENTRPSIDENGTVTIERGNCDTMGYEWTTLMSKDTPDNGGDFEFFHSFSSDEACANPTGIRATTSDSGAGSWPVHIDLTMGFWCVNSEQSGGVCEDWSVQFCCAKTATGACDQTGYSWSEWYNVDQPDESGDWELRSDDMCSNPTQVKAETLSGNAFNDMTHIDTDIGFWCINEENGGACEDYRVSFCCPLLAEGQCDAYGHSWGAWLDIDDPETGNGDMEIKTSFSEYEVCDAPTGIEARLVNATETPAPAFSRISKEEGFVCINDIFNTCSDYEVTWCCPKWGHGNLHCDIKGYEWTSWLDFDSPDSSTGDWETRASYAERAVCSNPIGIQAYPITLGSTEVTHIDTEVGFWCVNEEQSSGDCADFAARYCCPQFEEGNCDVEGYEWTDWLDRDDPTGEGDYETRHDFSTDQVCENPIAIAAEARTSGASDVTHVDLEYGFWCTNSEQDGKDCADYQVKFCCPKKNEKKCDAEGHVWTPWMDRDDPVETGDWENREGYPVNMVCSSPTAVEAQVKAGSYGSTKVTHLDNNHGFWCINDEQPKDEQCADFEVRFCCPDDYVDPCAYSGLMCGDNSHILYQTVNDTHSECVCACDEGFKQNGTDTRLGDDWACENTHGTCVKMYKMEKTWMEARDFCLALGTDLPSVPSSTYQAWLDDMWSGTYWLGLNDNDVADTFVYTNGDVNTYQNWGNNQPLSFDPYNCVMVQTNGKWSTGRCDKHTSNFFCQVKKSPTECIEDKPCEASTTECVDFDTCINKNNGLTKLGDADCTGVTCTDCVDGSDCVSTANGGGDGHLVECADLTSYPANNGGVSGYISCVCDGKNPCKWMSDDFQTEITEDDICVTDHVCPVTPFFMYQGELVYTRNRFLNDVTFNTLQSDLYDSKMAEVLGRIEVPALADFNTWDWSEGHHLVIVWPTDLSAGMNICPYGDYYDPAESVMGDGLIQVFETFTNSLVLRDSSPRDLAQNLEVVLNIRHDYDLDVEDINELLIFRIAMIPKTWTDAYGDTIKKTSGEIAECLNSILTEKAKIDGWIRKQNPSKKPSKWNKNQNKKPNKNKWNKWKNDKKMTPEQWKHKNAARKARLGL